MNGNKNDQPDALSPAMTARALGVGTTTVYELLKSGELVSFRVGRARRIPRKAIEDFISRNTVGALND